jgi:hypothetical protein
MPEEETLRLSLRQSTHAAHKDVSPSHGNEIGAIGSALAAGLGQTSFRSAEAAKEIDGGTDYSSDTTDENEEEVAIVPSHKVHV